MEDVATHFLLRLVPSLVPIGTIRGYKQPGSEYYKLSRLAVLEPYRRFRFGKSLVLALHDWVWKDASLAVISTRLVSEDFPISHSFGRSSIPYQAPQGKPESI